VRKVAAPAGKESPKSHGCALAGLAVNSPALALRELVGRHARGTHIN